MIELIHPKMEITAADLEVGEAMSCNDEVFNGWLIMRLAPESYLLHDGSKWQHWTKAKDPKGYRVDVTITVK